MESDQDGFKLCGIDSYNNLDCVFRFSSILNPVQICDPVPHSGHR